MNWLVTLGHWIGINLTFHLRRSTTEFPIRFSQISFSTFVFLLISIRCIGPTYFDFLDCWLLLSAAVFLEPVVEFVQLLAIDVEISLKNKNRRPIGTAIGSFNCNLIANFKQNQFISFNSIEIPPHPVSHFRSINCNGHWNLNRIKPPYKE